MNTLMTLIDQPLLQRLGWTLVHSVWQCAAAAMLLAVGLAMLRRSGARYAASCFALILAVATPAATYVYLGIGSSTEPQSGPLGMSPTDLRTMAISPDAQPILSPGAQPTIDPLHASLPGAAIVWLVGVLLLCARHAGGWIAVQRLRRDSITLRSHRGFERLLVRLRIRTIVRLAQSTRVYAPSVIGWLRPVVIVPFSALTGLNPMHLEALLAHELAHVRRHDYLFNLIQIAIETLLFYHPAVWWISRQIRQEREHCCDDIAIEVTGDRRGYVEALAAMETLRMSSNPLALASNGGSLLRRVRRLVVPQTQRGSVIWPALLMLAVVFTVAACNQALSPQVKAQEATDPAAAMTPPTSTTPASALNPFANTTVEVPAATLGQTDSTTTSSQFGPVEARLKARRDEQLRANLEQQLIELEMQLARDQASYSNDHPKMVQLRRQIETARNKLTEWEIRERTTVPLPDPARVKQYDVQLQKQLADLKAQLAAAQAAGQADPQIAQLNGRVAETQAMLAKIALLADVAKYPHGQPQPSAYYISGVKNSGPVPISVGGTLPLKSVLQELAAENPIDTKRVVVVRARPTKGRSVETYTVADVLNDKQPVDSIRAGDVVMLTDKLSAEMEAAALGPHITIEGAAPRPGPIPWHAGMTLLQAAVASGIDPLSPGELVLTVHRGNNPPSIHQLRALVVSAGDSELKPGDRIVVALGKESH